MHHGEQLTQYRCPGALVSNSFPALKQHRAASIEAFRARDSPISPWKTTRPNRKPMRALGDAVQSRSGEARRAPRAGPPVANLAEGTRTRAGRADCRMVCQAAKPRPKIVGLPGATFLTTQTANGGRSCASADTGARRAGPIAGWSAKQQSRVRRLWDCQGQPSSRPRLLALGGPVQARTGRLREAYERDRGLPICPANGHGQNRNFGGHVGLTIAL